MSNKDDLKRLIKREALNPSDTLTRQELQQWADKQRIVKPKKSLFTDSKIIRI